MYTLTELITFCRRHNIDTDFVTFNYGHKEVVACFGFGAHEDIPLEPATDENDEYPDLLEDLYYSGDYGAYVMRID